MKHVLISFDESSYQGQLASFEAAAELIQEVVEQYNELDLPKLNNEDFKRLFNEPVDLVFDKMTNGQPISIGKYEINKSKAIEIMEKPVGYEAFLMKLSEVSKSLAANHLPPLNINITSGTVNSHFEITSSGEVTLKESTRLAIENANKRFASTDAAKNVLGFAKAVIEAYEKYDIKHAGSIDGNGLSGFIKGIINYKDSSIYQGESRKLSINTEGIVQYNNNMIYTSPVQ